MSIFVSIAAYNEPHLYFTVREVLSKATNPSDLHIGVFDQNLEDRYDGLFAMCKQFGAKLSYMRIDPFQSRGASWARFVIASFYQNEDYVLQIDSHMMFDKGYDSKLIQQIKSTSYDKSIITCYPYGFKFDEYDNPVKTFEDRNTKIMKHVPIIETDADAFKNNSVIRFDTDFVTTTEPFILGYHVAGGFIFAHGYLYKEVLPDPQMYFHGEEQSIALRAYTRGWNIYHFKEVLIYHLYKTSDTPYDEHHWNATHDEQRSIRWWERDNHAKKRLDMLVNGDDLGIFSLGNVRSLEEYAVFSGIDYKNRTIASKRGS